MNLRKLLIVDDEIEIINVISRLLAKYDGYIIYATSGNSAVEELKLHDIGLVITDFKMSDGNGDFILNYVLANRLDLDFYFFTASNIDHFLGSGVVSGCFIKPSDFGKLIATVKKYFKVRGLPKEAPEI
jgi:DNA-binding NtrC family response regulator